MTKSKLLDLADRVEALQGPVREVDHGIYEAIGKPVVSIAGPATHGTDLVNWAPFYTQSLDAAMSLKPEGWRMRVMNFSAPCADDRKWHLNLYGGREGENTFVGRGATPALALTAACLRARAQAEEA